MKRIMAQVWNKLVDSHGRNRVRFRSGTVYEVGPTGAIKRLTPPPQVAWQIGASGVFENPPATT